MNPHLLSISENLMTEIPSPFVRATSMLAPSLLLLLSATGVHAEISTHTITIVSAPPITIENEAVYQAFGDCTYGDNSQVTVTFSDGVHDDVVVEGIPCVETGEWSIEAAGKVDITGFGSGLVDENGILERDVTIQANLTNPYGLNAYHSVSVHRDPDPSRPAPDLMISLIESRIVVDDEFKGGARCGASEVTMDNYGKITVNETDCARMVSTTNPNATLVMTDSLTGASGACEFETLTMHGAGHIQITMDPEAAMRCIDDKDFDGILDMQDPEPGTDVNNRVCADSQNLIDNVALTDAEIICEANDSITVQGVRLPDASDVCYEAGQFVRFATPALVASAGPEPVFVVPTGTKFHIPGSAGTPCGS